MFAIKNEKKRVLLAMKEARQSNVVEKLVDFSYGDCLAFTVSKDGVDATAKVKYQGFQCIILDYDLPRKSGEAVINSIRNSQYNEHTPVILLVDDDEVALEKEFPEIYFFKKPIDGAKLIELAEKTLGLGAGDQRVCASLVNIVAQATSNFFSTYQKKPMSIEGPSMAPLKNVLEAQNVKISMKYQGAQVQLLLAFPEESLQAMKKDLKFLQKIDNDKIAKSLALFTLQRSIDNFARTYQATTQIEMANSDTLKHRGEEDVIVVQFSNQSDIQLSLMVLEG